MARRWRRGPVTVVAALVAAVVVAGSTGCTPGDPPAAAQGSAPAADVAPLRPLARPSAPVGGTMGVSPGAGILSLPDADLDRELALWRSLGLRWLRVDIDVSTVAPTPGDRDWSAPDRVLGAAREHDLEPIGLLTYAPGWMRRADGSPDPVQFADLAAEAVRRYSTGVAVWEIWNEPNAEDFWGSAPDPIAYADLLARTSAAVRATDPGATVLSGGMARGSDGRGLLSPRTFLSGVLDRVPPGTVDGVAVHPYSYPALPSDPGNPVQQLPALHRLVEGSANGSASLWITEFGAPTGTSSRAVAPERQARILAEARALARSWEWAGPILWFSGRDRGSDPADAEQNFGVVTEDYRPKPALGVLRDGLSPGSPVPSATEPRR